MGASMTASPLLHPPIVAPYQGAHSRVPVLRRWLVWAFGVIRSAGLVACPAETRGTHLVASLDSRADLAGSARPFGSLSFRARSCLQALAVRVVLSSRAYPIRLTGKP